MFQYQSIDLPIAEATPRLKSTLAEHSTVLLGAPAGAGKSTLVPLCLINETWLKGKKILMLEPRRLAAISIAQRMAELLDQKVAEQVGYRIRFETKVGKNTKIEVITEGILTRMLQSDNELQEVGLVIFDEFHERNLHADLALALVRQSQKILRPDLKILVMSATLNMPELSEMLSAPVVESAGKMYSVDIHYQGTSDERLIAESTALAILKAIENHKGDILAFLPGQAEILKTQAILKGKAKNVLIYPLYGMLNKSKQLSAILPNKEGKRKVVLATSIAETSLTIEGVHIVVDSGFGRVSKYNANSGLSGLQTIQISKDSADQRAGRAGRLAPGVCYRLWSKADQQRMQPNRVPEILLTDLTHLVLELYSWGTTNYQELEWLNPPPKGTVKSSEELLMHMEAIDEKGITHYGRQLNNIPAHPRIAHMLLSAKQDGLLGLGCDLAAILESRDPLKSEAGIDINIRIEALRRYRKQSALKGKWGSIDKIANSYRQYFKIDQDNGLVNEFDTGFLLAKAYPERIAHARPGNNAQFRLSNGRLASASHKDDLAYEPWLAVAHIDARGGAGKIFLASAINPKDLASLVSEKKVLRWDTKKGGLIAEQQMRIGGIVLDSKPLNKIDETQKLQIVLEAIKKEGENLLSWNKDVTQLQNRITSIRLWNNDASWPNYSTKNLISTAELWLPPYLQNVSSNEDLEELNLYEILFHNLPYEKQQELDKLAPVKLELPSGVNAKLQYQEKGAPPILSAKIQQLFGLHTTPKVNEGKIKLLIHILSPGFKPVQVTDDMESFWKNTYAEVKKELKGRYPKHDWPNLLK